MSEKNKIPSTQALFKYRFLYVLVLILMMLVIGPLVESVVRLRILMEIFLTAILVSGMYVLSQKKHHLVLAALLAVPMLASLWSVHFVTSTPVVVVGQLCGAAFFALAVINILAFIYRQHEVSSDLITGAALAYLFMALMWSFIYTVVEVLVPGSFAIPEGLAESALNFTYYSFVTITTLGFGDITPTTSLASSLSILEAVVGQLYLVVQVAWLVGVHVSQSMQKTIDRD